VEHGRRRSLKEFYLIGKGVLKSFEGFKKV
jgi:hypothetical protein